MIDKIVFFITNSASPGVVYGGPIGRAMCRLPCDDVHAMIDGVDVTIDDIDVTIDDVRCVTVIIIPTCAQTTRS